eukprot:2206142-Amphidinium_carterae.2
MEIEQINCMRSKGQECKSRQKACQSKARAKVIHKTKAKENKSHSVEPSAPTTTTTSLQEDVEEQHCYKENKKKVKNRIVVQSVSDEEQNETIIRAT